VSSASNRLDPLTVLQDTASLFRRKAEMYRALYVGCNGNGGEGWRVRCEIYQHESDRLDDLIGLCDGTATVNASADTLPVAAETAGIDVLPSYVTVADSTVGDVVDEDATTLPLMPRSGLTPSR
jgi:hypothetical protein